jgi:hypothetical protein
MADTVPPYGPQTALLRRFLHRLSTQPVVVWLAAARRYEQHAATPAQRRADRALGAAVPRLGREHARDLLVGPVLQLARRAAAYAAESPDADDALHRLAEPALAAALALLVADGLAEEQVAALYAPFEGAIPRASLADDAPPTLAAPSADPA